MGGKDENAGWLPPPLWNVFTKGCVRLWSLDSRPCISNILLFCLCLWVFFFPLSLCFLFIFYSFAAEFKSCSNCYSRSQLFHLLILLSLVAFFQRQKREKTWVRCKYWKLQCQKIGFILLFPQAALFTCFGVQISHYFSHTFIAAAPLFTLWLHTSFNCLSL